MSTLLAWWYSPKLDQTLPVGVIFVHGLLLFLYQTFDAVDGKQARSNFPCAFDSTRGLSGAPVWPGPQRLNEPFAPAAGKTNRLIKSPR